MSWVDQLAEASFRGVPFQVDTIEHAAGDTVVLREYPFADLPTVFRMGEAAEQIKFSAYVVGDDYLTQRDALRQVLTGEGVLIHPTAGSMRCFVLGPYQMREAPSAEGGLCRFDLTFVRAEPRRYPVGVANTQATATAAGTSAKASAVDQFSADWTTAGKPGWVAAAAVARLQAVLAPVMSLVANAAANLAEVNTDLMGAYGTLRDGLDSLVQAPRELAAQVSLLLSLPGEMTQAATRDFQSAFAWAMKAGSNVAQAPFETRVVPAEGAGLVIYGTGTTAALPADNVARAELDRLHAASDRLVESLATAAWVQATAALELDNYDQALSLRATVHTQCMRLLRDASTLPAAPLAADSSWYDALLLLHTTALADLQARSRDLVRLTQYTPQTWEPVWLISYRLWGTADYADEILAMNPHITHPLLVPPGVALRIVRH